MEVVEMPDGPPWPQPVIMYGFCGEGDRGSFYRYLFETEEKARSFAGHWKGEIVKVEVRPLVFFEKSGDLDFR